MAALQHVYVTAHGEYTASAWIGETAQVGVRLAIVPDGAIPSPGSTFTIPANGDVTADYGTATGTHGSLNKTWTARMGPTGSLENADSDWQIDLAEDFWTFLNGLKVYQYSGFRWTHIKIAPILADGKYGAPAAQYTFTTPLAGTDTGYAAQPPEVALCFSLRSPVVGRRGRGRIYVPAITTHYVNTDGTVSTSVNDLLRALFVTLVGSLQNFPGASEYEGVVMVTSAGKADAIKPLEVRIGNHWDVQRRRQAQAEESYLATTLT